jgi:carbon-monoxide dehydrogenase iron sulfur subunit
MSKKITVNIERCLGCHTCQLACAVAHSSAANTSGDARQAGRAAFDPAVAAFGTDVVAVAATGEKPGYRIHVEHYGPKSVPLSCQHCEEAACVLACPTGAVKRLAPGKPVLVDEARCIGCSMCVQACPFGVMAMRAGGKVAFKCDLCITRLARGLQPACVSSCPTRALSLEEEESSSRDKRRAAVERLVSAQTAAEGAAANAAGAAGAR